MSCQEQGRPQELAYVSNGIVWIGVFGRLRRLAPLQNSNPSFKRVGVGGSDGKTASATVEVAAVRAL